MSQKLTLAVYLKGRGEVKSLTRIEAEAFGVPYPLVSGWPVRHGHIEITQVMLDDLTQRIIVARRSTANKALRGLDGLGTVVTTPSAQPLVPEMQSPAGIEQRSVIPTAPGFVLRRARRYRALHSTPRI